MEKREHTVGVNVFSQGNAVKYGRQKTTHIRLGLLMGFNHPAEWMFQVGPGYSIHDAEMNCFRAKAFAGLA